MNQKSVHETHNNNSNNQNNQNNNKLITATVSTITNNKMYLSKPIAPSVPVKELKPEPAKDIEANKLDKFLE